MNKSNRVPIYIRHVSFSEASSVSPDSVRAIRIASENLVQEAKKDVIYRRESARVDILRDVRKEHRWGQSD